jgi:hypothetical protein
VQIDFFKDIENGNTWNLPPAHQPIKTSFEGIPADHTTAMQVTVAKEIGKLPTTTTRHASSGSAARLA